MPRWTWGIRCPAEAWTSRVANDHVRSTHSWCRSGGGFAAGGALGCVTGVSGGQRAVVREPAASAGATPPCWARTASGEAHCCSTIGQCRSPSGAWVAIGSACRPASADMCPPAASPLAASAAAAEDVICIESGIAIAGRASPVRQSMSAHTMSAPESPRSAGGTHRVMPVMLRAGSQSRLMGTSRVAACRERGASLLGPGGRPAGTYPQRLFVQRGAADAGLLGDLRQGRLHRPARNQPVEPCGHGRAVGAGRGRKAS